MKDRTADMPVKALVVPDLQAPRVNSNSDLHLDSGGDVAVSLPRSSKALVMSTTDDTTTLSSRDNNMQVRTPSISFNSSVAELVAPNAVSMRAGSQDALSSVSRGVAESRNTIAGTGTKDGDNSAGSYLTATIADVALGSQDNSIKLTKDGNAEYRSREHILAIGADDIFKVTPDTMYSAVDIDITGSLNSVEGTLRILQIADPSISLSSSSVVDNNIAGGPTGVSVRTVPASVADIEYMSSFKADDGSALFIDAATDKVDVPKAVSADIFDHTIAYEVNDGMRKLGARTATSRLDSPAWDVSGSSLRISRCVPDSETLGNVNLYAMNLRVTDEGNFEVNRFKQVLTWDSGNEVYYGSAPEVVVMHEFI